MVKKGAKKRTVIKPNFLPQIPMPSTPALRELAKEKSLDLLDSMAGEGKKKKLEELGARFVMNKRMKISMENTGRFYVSLYNALYGGEILRNNEAPLFENTETTYNFSSSFKPDIIIKGNLKTTCIEVKATSVHQGKTKFAHRQYLRYSQAFLEDKGSEMYVAIFKYGKRRPLKLYVCKNEDGHKCDNRCLVDKLSNLTRSLLIMPHNLLTFLLMLPYSREEDHSTSNTSRDFEYYKEPWGKWVSLLHEHWENPDLAITKILKHAESKHMDFFDDFSRDDFYLGFKTRQYDAPKIYCRGRRIGNKNKFRQGLEPFIITEYKTLYNIKWKKHFRANFDKFVDALRMKEDYEKMLGWDESVAERIAIKETGQMEAQVKPDDGIPI